MKTSLLGLIAALVLLLGSSCSITGTKSVSISGSAQPAIQTVYDDTSGLPEVLLLQAGETKYSLPVVGTGTQWNLAQTLISPGTYDIVVNGNSNAPLVATTLQLDAVAIDPATFASSWDWVGTTYNYSATTTIPDVTIETSGVITLTLDELAM